MIAIYEIGQNGRWTGRTEEIDEASGCPLGWTRTTPPAMAEGEIAAWLGTGWGISAVDQVDEARVALRASAAAKRYDVETGGILVGGVLVKTDRESQAMVTGAAAAAAAGVTPIDWKAANGWVQLSAAQVTALAAAVAVHVQGCFSREREICEAIDAAGTVPELLAIDLSAGWPG